MRKKFSTKWKASSQPRKQRKYRANAPNHVKRKFLSTTLSKELRQKHGMRNIEVKKGDEVKAMRGKFKGKQGKVTDIDVKNVRISIEGIQRTKKDGTKVNVWFHPSKVKIINLDTSDVKRLKQSKDKKSKNQTGEKEKISNVPKKK